MTQCMHESLEFVGEQKTDDGVNAYYRCRSCGEIVVMTPERKMIAIPAVQTNQPPHPAPAPKF